MKIVKINDDVPTPPGEPHEGVIEVLEKTLAEAREGKVSAVSMAIVTDDDKLKNRWAGRGASTWSLMASIRFLEQQYIRACLEP